MFATAHYMDVMPDGSRKRQHDETDLGSASQGFAEHRNKRVQCLPVRSSPTQAQQGLPSPSIVPLGYDGDDCMPRSHFSPWSSSPAPGGQFQNGIDAAEMDSANSPYSMAIDEASNAQQPSPSTARMPTPIQPSFAAQVRGQQWSGLAPPAGRNGIVNMGHQQSGLAGKGPCPLHGPQAGNDWQTLQNNRRLPSPISESGDSMPQGSPSGAGQSIQAMEHPNAMMDVEASRGGVLADDCMDPETPSPHRKGHTRNMHTVNTWTWQPGMKRSFSIGYRADCDKCRDKVPGHFNHIIIS